MHIGRELLNAGIRLGKQKDVTLSVAGSEKNLAAVNLYESVGFRWTSELKTEMRLDKSQLLPVGCSAASDGSADEGSDAVQTMGHPQATQAATSREMAPSEVEVPGPSGVSHSVPLSVDVGAASTSALGRSTPGASGATPHLAQLRLSPRFCSHPYTSMASSTSPRVSERTPRAEGTRSSPLARPAAGPAAAAEMPTLPPGPCVPSPGGLHDPTRTGKASKRRAPQPPAPQFAALPEVKSVKAAHDASPRSPGGGAKGLLSLRQATS